MYSHLKLKERKDQKLHPVIINYDSPLKSRWSSPWPTWKPFCFLYSETAVFKTNNKNKDTDCFKDASQLRVHSYKDRCLGGHSLSNREFILYLFVLPEIQWRRKWFENVTQVFFFSHLPFLTQFYDTSDKKKIRN